MANSLAELVVNLTAETASFSRKMDSAASDLKRFGQTADSVMRGVRNVAGTLGVAFSAGAIVDFVKQSIDAADKMNKLSQRVGVGTDVLTAFGYAARLADIDTETLAVAFQKMSKNAYEAANGNKSTAEAFKRIGVAIVDAGGKLRSADQIMLDLAGRFSQMKDGTEKTALAMEVFGRSGAQLIPFLNQGREGIAALTEEAHKLGLVLDPEMAQAAERVNDNVERLKGKWRGLANEIASSVLPQLERLTDELTKQQNIGEPGWLASSVSWAAKAAETFARGSYTGGKEVLAFPAALLTSVQTGGKSWQQALDMARKAHNDWLIEYAKIWTDWTPLENMGPGASHIPVVGGLKSSHGPGTVTPPPSTTTKTGTAKNLTAQIASAKAEIDSLLAQMAAENFNVAEKVRSDWQKSIDKIAEAFRKFPQLARLPEVQAAGGKDIMLFHAKMQAETAARAAQLEQDIKLLQDATKAYEQVLREMGGSDYPNIPNKPSAVPVLSDSPWTPYEVELEKLKRNTEDMGQLATDVWYQTRTAAESYAFELERLNILLDNGKISQETYNRAVDQLKARLDRNTISMREFGYEIGQVAQNAVTHWTGWRDMVDQLTQALIKLAFQLLVVNRIQEAMDKSGKSGGILGGIIGGLGGSWGALSFGGLHDYPGPAYAGTSYLIGTPEIFTPKTDGYITPLKGLKSGGDTNYYIDARGADAGVEARIMRAMVSYKNQAVQESVLSVEERRRRS